MPTIEQKRLYRRRWYERNKDRSRDTELQRKFGISAEDYDAILQAQNGLCAICHRTCPTGRRLAVDHDHETGQVRGLLCNSCNRALGAFQDDPAVLQSALEYLRRDDAGDIGV